MDEGQANDNDKLFMDLEKLTERELEDLAWLVVRKLREWMRAERDRMNH